MERLLSVDIDAGEAARLADCVEGGGVMELFGGVGDLYAPRAVFPVKVVGALRVSISMTSGEVAEITGIEGVGAMADGGGIGAVLIDVGSSASCGCGVPGTWICGVDVPSAGIVASIVAATLMQAVVVLSSMLAMWYCAGSSLDAETKPKVGSLELESRRNDAMSKSIG